MISLAQGQPTEQLASADRCPAALLFSLSVGFIVESRIQQTLSAIIT